MLKEGESVTASLVATQKNGQSVELSDVVYSVKGGTAIEVEGNQIKRACERTDSDSGGLHIRGAGSTGSRL